MVLKVCHCLIHSSVSQTKTTFENAAILTLKYLSIIVKLTSQLSNPCDEVKCQIPCDEVKHQIPCDEIEAPLRKEQYGA